MCAGFIGLLSPGGSVCKNAGGFPRIPAQSSLKTVIITVAREREGTMNRKWKVPEVAGPGIVAYKPTKLRGQDFFGNKKALISQGFFVSGGEGGIRTHGTLTRTPDFESGTFDHSATSPKRCAWSARAEHHKG
jgi:hypothetical protein